MPRYRPLRLAPSLWVVWDTQTHRPIEDGWRYPTYPAAQEAAADANERATWPTHCLVCGHAWHIPRQPGTHCGHCGAPADRRGAP